MRDRIARIGMVVETALIILIPILTIVAVVINFFRAAFRIG